MTTAKPHRQRLFTVDAEIVPREDGLFEVHVDDAVIRNRDESGMTLERAEAVLDYLAGTPPVTNGGARFGGRVRGTSVRLAALSFLF